MYLHYKHLTGDFGSNDEGQGDFIRKVFAVWHVRQFSLLQQTHLLPLLSQCCSLLSKKCWWTPGWETTQCYNTLFRGWRNNLFFKKTLHISEVTREKDVLAAYRRGFPISLLIVPHSTLVSFLVFKLGKDSLRQRQNSLSPSKRGLEEKREKKTPFRCVHQNFKLISYSWSKFMASGNISMLS